MLFGFICSSVFPPKQFAVSETRRTPACLESVFPGPAQEPAYSRSSLNTCKLEWQHTPVTQALATGDAEGRESQFQSALGLFYLKKDKTEAAKICMPALSFFANSTQRKRLRCWLNFKDNWKQRHAWSWTWNSNTRKRSETKTKIQVTLSLINQFTQAE